MDQAEEESFWGDCSNTYCEETKQLKYAELMGFPLFGDGRSPFCIRGHGGTYIDFGGGPCSLLLKFQGASRRIVVDPLKVPGWVAQRYKECGIFYERERCDIDFREMNGSLFYGAAIGSPEMFDCGLCYNVLQHVENPQKFVKNLRDVSATQAVFEWIDLPPHPGHPNMLTADCLSEWFGRKGITGELKGENECWGRYWVLHP